MSAVEQGKGCFYGLLWASMAVLANVRETVIRKNQLSATVGQNWERQVRQLL